MRSCTLSEGKVVALCRHPLREHLSMEVASIFFINAFISRLLLHEAVLAVGEYKSWRMCNTNE